MSDLISRQAAIDAIHEDILLKPHNDSWFRENHEFVTVGYVERTLLAVPSAQPERKRGKWIDEAYDFIISGRCSVCGWEAHLYEDDVVGMNYCPNCGAKMDGCEEE